MKNLALRTMSGIVYVALIVCAILLGKFWFLALTTLFCMLAMVEFRHIVQRPLSNAWQVAAAVVDVLAGVMLSLITSLPILPDWLIAASAVVVTLYVLIRFTLALYDKDKNAYSDTAWSALSLLYIAVPFAMLNSVYSDYGSSAMVILAMFVLIWLNDTGAYCVGSLIGKNPMFPRLSPKKSWEGFFGGLAFCVGASIGAYYLIPRSFSLGAWIGFGIMVCVLSTWGDLFESLLKRSHAIKDSGHLIPGHGGILDRIDSLLFVSVGTFAFYLFFT